MKEIVIVVESQADARIAVKLAERVLLERIEWLDLTTIEYQLRWTGLLESSNHSCWSDLKHEIEQLGIRTPRYIGGKDRTTPLKSDGATAIKVLNAVSELRKKREICAVVFIRDIDNQPKRKQWLEDARPKDQVVIIGTPLPNREAWVLNGFEPQDNDERMRLEELKESLTFNPCLEAHRLRSTKKTGEERERNIKIVLAELTNSDFERERLCWEETALATLRTNGTETGLTNYLDEVENRLLPLIN